MIYQTEAVGVAHCFGLLLIIGHIKYWCPVKFLGRCRPEGPISYQPRATPWVG